MLNCLPFGVGETTFLWSETPPITSSLRGVIPAFNSQYVSLHYMPFS